MANTRENVRKELRAMATTLNAASMELFAASDDVVGDVPAGALGAIHASTASDLIYAMDGAIHKLRRQLFGSPYHTTQCESPPSNK